MLVAYIQLGALNKTSKADFLFRLDQQYGNKSIIKARQIIHRLYLESKKINKDACECQHRKYIADEINKMSNEQKDGDDYILLLNLLDFLETLAYQAKNENIEFKDVEDLIGPSAKFFYQIFYLRIKERRKKYLDQKYYCEFENLIKKMQKKNDSKKCCWCNCTTEACKSCGCSVLNTLD